MLQERGREALLQCGTGLFGVFFLEQVDDPIAMRAKETQGQVRRGQCVPGGHRLVELADEIVENLSRDPNREAFDAMNPVPELQLEAVAHESKHEIAADIDQHSHQFVHALRVGFFGEIIASDLFELFTQAFDVVITPALDSHPNGRRQHVTVHLQDLVGEFRIREIVEFEQMAQHVEAGLVERGDLGTTRQDLDQAELGERPQTLSNGTAVDARALGEISLGGQTIAGAESTAQDVIAEVANDTLDRCREGEHGKRILGGAENWSDQIGLTKGRY